MLQLSGNGTRVGAVARKSELNIQRAPVIEAKQPVRAPGRPRCCGDQNAPVPGSHGTLLPVHGAVANAPTRGAGTQARPS